MPKAKSTISLKQIEEILNDGSDSDRVYHILAFTPEQWIEVCAALQEYVKSCGQKYQNSRKDAQAVLTHLEKILDFTPEP